MQKRAIGLLVILSCISLTACGKKNVSEDIIYTDISQQSTIKELESETENENNQEPVSQEVHITDEQLDMAYDDYGCLLSTDDNFYEKAALNPVEQNYIIDFEASTLELRQAMWEKCEAWNKQIAYTEEQLQKLLSTSDCDKLQKALDLWNEYYEEEKNQNFDMYGVSGMIMGSMYTVTSLDVLMEKSRLISSALLSVEYELSQDLSFDDEVEMSSDVSWHDFSKEAFCIEYSQEFEDILNSYTIDEKDSSELEELINEAATKIEEKFGHDYVEHANKYVSFINELNEIEKNVSKDSRRCLLVKENRLKLYAAELLNIEYMLEMFVE